MSSDVKCAGLDFGDRIVPPGRRSNDIGSFSTARTVSPEGTMTVSHPWRGRRRVLFRRNKGVKQPEV